MTIFSVVADLTGELPPSIWVADFKGQYRREVKIRKHID
jgi:hypothetical protein